MDYVNDQCKRANCKYLHPSQHICNQIHDHKKKPHLALRTRSLSNSSDTGFSNSTEEFFHPQVQLPYPLNMYYPNPHHPNAYFFPRAPLNISGQGLGSSYSYQQTPEYQYSSATHETEEINLDRNYQDQFHIPVCPPLFIPQYPHPIKTN